MARALRCVRCVAFFSRIPVDYLRRAIGSERNHEAVARTTKSADFPHDDEDDDVEESWLAVANAWAHSPAADTRGW